MALLSATFVACLIAAHIACGGVDALPLELSLFRESEAWLLGYLMFAILFAIGALLIARLVRHPNEEASTSICCIVFALLVLVAATPSIDVVHIAASLAVLGLLYLLYACWLNERGDPWLRNHLAMPAM